MLLPLTTAPLPATVGPPRGFSVFRPCHLMSPVLPSRQNSERSPTCSLSRKADATSTLPPATPTGASTCHFSLPCSQSLTGAGLGRLSKLGGIAKSGSFFFSTSYFACSSVHF